MSDCSLEAFLVLFFLFCKNILFLVLVSCSWGLEGSLAISLFVRELLLRHISKHISVILYPYMYPPGGY